MNDDFLNRKEIPTQTQILRYFFKREDIEEMLESLEFAIEGPPDLESLGKPDEVQTASGTEWEISRVKWVTDKGPKYLIYLKKVGYGFSNIDLPKFNDTMNSTNDELFKNPFFNYNNEDVVDIDFEDVEEVSYQELLDFAIENENFEEAARLRDWNKGLIELLKELKPLFIEAIENSDLEALDRYHRRLNDYRAKL